MLHLALEAALAEVHGRPEPLLAELGHSPEHTLARRRLGDREQEPGSAPIGARGRAGVDRAAGLHRLGDPLEAGGPAHPGRRVAADLLDQPVIAAAAADPALRAERIRSELEHGP